MNEEVSQAPGITQATTEERHSRTARLTVRGVWRAAWQLFRSSPLRINGLILSYLGLYVGFNVLVALTGAVLMVLAGAVFGLLGVVLVGVATTVVSYGVGLWVSAGLIAFLADFSKDRAASYKLLVSSRRRRESMLTIYILGMVNLFGFMLLIIPGLIWSVTYLFAPYLVYERNLSPMEALAASKQVTSGNRWRIFGISVLMGLAAVLVLVVPVIGIVVALGMVADMMSPWMIVVGFVLAGCVWLALMVMVASLTSLLAVALYRQLAAGHEFSTPPMVKSGLRVLVLFATILISSLLLIGTITDAVIPDDDAPHSVPAGERNNSGPVELFATTPSHVS